MRLFWQRVIYCVMMFLNIVCILAFLSYIIGLIWIDISRYESYLAFVEEAREYKERVKYEGRKVEHSKKIVNDKQVAKIGSKKRQSARNTMKQQIYKELEEDE